MKNENSKTTVIFDNNYKPRIILALKNRNALRRHFIIETIEFFSTYARLLILFELSSLNNINLSEKI